MWQHGFESIQIILPVVDLQNLVTPITGNEIKVFHFHIKCKSKLFLKPKTFSVFDYIFLIQTSQKKQIFSTSFNQLLFESSSVTFTSLRISQTKLVCENFRTQILGIFIWWEIRMHWQVEQESQLVKDCLGWLKVMRYKLCIKTFFFEGFRKLNVFFGFFRFPNKEPMSISDSDIKLLGNIWSKIIENCIRLFFLVYQNC